MITLIVNGVVLIDWKNVENADNISVPKLSNNTANTWQSDRTDEEKAADTKIGKLAENAFITCLKTLGIRDYVSYDSIRTDNFELHAPFDGLFCSNLTDEIKNFINLSVRNEGPKLCAKTRSILREMGVLTVEIKSTRLAKKYKDKTGFSSYGSEKELTDLIETLKDLDYLTYPFFTRYGDMSFDEYCWFAEKKIKTGLRGDALREKIARIEKENSDDLYVRVFVDEVSKKCLVMGWIDADTFFDDPQTHKLVLPGKSEVPLYLIKSIRKGHSLTELHNHLSLHHLDKSMKETKDINANDNTKDDETKQEEVEESLLERIKSLLKNTNKGLKSGKIAEILGVNKKEVNQTLYGNNSIFVCDFFKNWKLKEQAK